MFTISINAEETETYEFDHSTACEFLDNLGIIGLEACRDAEDYGDATYFGDNNVPVFIEFHTDSRI